MGDLTKQDIIYHHHNYRILLQNPFSQYSFIKSLSEYSFFVPNISQSQSYNAPLLDQALTWLND